MPEYIGYNNSIATTGIYANYRPSRFALAPTTPPAPPGDDDRSELISARKAIVTMRGAIDEIQELLRPMRGNGGSAAVSAISRADLDLDVTLSYAEMSSVEEVNTTPTSFSPFGPVIDGDSTSEVTIDGVYTGTIDDTFTFKVKKTGEVGEDKFDVEVRNGEGDKTDTIKMKKEDTPPGTEFILSSGLVVSFSAGELEKKDTFEVDVYTSIPSAVDPDKPLMGVRNDNPNLEYGLEVTPGSFEVNGETITVDASDSMNMVLDKITASAAGVNASFDAATERVVLTQKTAGAEYSITLGNDSSGFLVATKLDTATVIPGTHGIPDTPIDQVAQLAGISSGTLFVNGTGISIDVSVDSLQDVLTRISISGAGVSAQLDATGDRVSVTSNTPGQQVVIDSGDTNFFPVLLIDDGSYDPEEGGGLENRLSRSDYEALTEAFREVSESFGTIYANAPADSLMQQLRDGLRENTATAFNSSGPDFRTKFGIRFDFDNTPKRILEFTVANGRELEKVLRDDYTDIETLLFGEPKDESDGLFDMMRATLDDVEIKLRENLGSTGTLLNVQV